MDVNYGQQLKKFLLSQVTLLRIHRFALKDMQFGDALVSSAVVWLRKAVPDANHTVEFTEGGTLNEPNVATSISTDVLRLANKWTKLFRTSPSTVFEHKQLKLSDLFTIKRGLATGANQFFILTPQQVSDYQIPEEVLKPILPSPRYLSVDEVETDSIGNPILERQLFLLECDWPEDKVKSTHPSLWQYFQKGVKSGISGRYLCKHRSPWYSQENRPASKFLCTYMGREGTKNGRLFRFILNYSMATAANVYLLLYPKVNLEKILKVNPKLTKVVWEALNTISSETLTDEGRVYGGGLHKLEPRELGNTEADNILAVLPELTNSFL